MSGSEDPRDEFDRLFPAERLEAVRRRLVSFFHFHGWKGGTRDTPDDLAHETIIRGRRRIGAGVELRTDPILYLLGIARNVALEDRRAALRSKLEPIEPDDHVGGARDVERVENRLLIQELLSGLSPEDRAVFVTYVLGDRKQLVRKLDTTSGALRVRIHRIRERLRGQHAPRPVRPDHT